MLHLFYLRDMTGAAWARLRPHNDDVVRYQMQLHDGTPHGFVVDVYCGAVVLFGAAFGGDEIVIENTVGCGWIPLNDNDFYTKVIHQKMVSYDLEVRISDNAVQSIQCDGGFAYSIDDNRLLHMFAHPDGTVGSINQKEISVPAQTLQTSSECYGIDSEGDPCGLYVYCAAEYGYDTLIPKAVRFYGEKYESYVENFTLTLGDRGDVNTGAGTSITATTTFWYLHKDKDTVVALLYTSACRYTGVTVEYSIAGGVLSVHRVLVPDG